MTNVTLRVFPVLINGGGLMEPQKRPTRAEFAEIPSLISRKSYRQPALYSNLNLVN